jgi:hypothetical protein
MNRTKANLGLLLLNFLNQKGPKKRKTGQNHETNREEAASNYEEQEEIQK